MWYDILGYKKMFWVQEGSLEAKDLFDSVIADTKNFVLNGA